LNEREKRKKTQQGEETKGKKVGAIEYDEGVGMGSPELAAPRGSKFAEEGKETRGRGKSIGGKILEAI